MQLKVEYKSWKFLQIKKSISVFEFDERIRFSIWESAIITREDHLLSEDESILTTLNLKSDHILIFSRGGAYITDPKNEFDEDGNLALYELHHALKMACLILKSTPHSDRNAANRELNDYLLFQTYKELLAFKAVGCSTAAIFLKMLGCLIQEAAKDEIG